MATGGIVLFVSARPGPGEGKNPSVAVIARGEKLYRNLCSRCHSVSFGRAAAGRFKGDSGFDRIIGSMTRRFCDGRTLRPDEMKDLRSFLLKAAPSKGTEPADRKVGEGLFRKKCGTCHRAEEYVVKYWPRINSAAGWEKLVASERARDKSRFTHEEGAKIALYLSWAWPEPLKGLKERNLRAKIERKCRSCHSFDFRTLAPRLGPDWDLTVETMRRLHPILLGVDESRRIAAYFKKRHLLKPRTAKERSYENLRLLFRRKCVRCHSISLARNPGEYFESWAEEVERMRLKSPTFYTKEQGRRIAGFLADE
jgi:cytochrome c2